MRFSLILMFLMDEAVVGSIISITNSQQKSSSPKLELGKVENRDRLSLQTGHKKIPLWIE